MSISSWNRESEKTGMQIKSDIHHISQLFKTNNHIPSLVSWLSVTNIQDNHFIDESLYSPGYLLIG